MLLKWRQVVRRGKYQRTRSSVDHTPSHSQFGVLKFPTLIVSSSHTVTLLRGLCSDASHMPSRYLSELAPGSDLDSSPSCSLSAL